MINRSLMYGGNSSFPSDTDEEQRTAPIDDSTQNEELVQTAEPEDEGDAFENLSEGEFEYPMPEEWNDPFDCLPPNEPQLSEEEEEEVRRKQEEEGNDIPPISENTEFETAIEPVKEVTDNTVMIIDGIRKVLRTVMESAADEGFPEQEKKRDYKNVAKFDKPSFAKPKESQPSMKPKLIMAGLVTAGISTYFGLEANTYFILNQSKHPTALNCTFGWLTEVPDIQVSPFYADIFWTAFGVIAFIMAVIIFFIWDSSEGKKRRREGKEHGDGRLATPTDFKKYKGRFMD